MSHVLLVDCTITCTSTCTSTYHAQARSVTAQSDRSPHRLDRSPHSPIGHRTGSIGHRTVRSVTAQSDRSPHRLDRSPHSLIGHRTGSIGHRTVRSVTAQGNLNNTVNSILGNFKLTETCQKRFSKTQNRISKNAFMYFWATVLATSLRLCRDVTPVSFKRSGIVRNSRCLRWPP